MSNFSMGMAAAAVISMAGTAFGGYTITQGSSAPTYTTTLNFDEPGGPTGSVAPNAFASYGLADLQAGDGNEYVDDVSLLPGYSWLGTGNSFQGHYGVFMQFDSDLTEFSTQFWDPSGPPSFFGGGAILFLFNDGVQLDDYLSFEPAWGGVGDEWLNVTTDGGSVFDEIRILGYGFFPESHVDNMSWNAVPAPGSAIALGALGLAGLRRRRA